MAANPSWRAPRAERRWYGGLMSTGVASGPSWKGWLIAPAFLASFGIAVAQPATSLQSFYVQSQVEGGQQIVELSQQGRDVRVRTISVVSVDWQCPNLVVRAYDQVVANTTVEALARTPLCGITEQRFTRAVGRSRDRKVRSIDWFGWRGSVVASCGGQERRFPFLQEPGDQLDPAKLARRDPDVHKVWMLTAAATDGTLVRATERPNEEAQETLGTTLLPDLVEGKYETGYRDACWDEARQRTVPCAPNYFAWRLEGYTGPPAQRGPLPLRLVDHEQWQFVSYVPPVFPPIALSARMSGDVTLTLEVDPVSGAVVRATVAKGIPLLDQAALVAARQWRFVPGSTPTGSFDVAVRFQVKCPQG